MITYHKISHHKIPISPYEVFISPPRREPLDIKKNALTDAVTQFIDVALTRLIDTRLRNQINIDSKIQYLPSDTSLNNTTHLIDSKLTWRSKKLPTLTDEQKDSLISLELFCKDHNKQLFFGPNECKKIFIENAIWIDDANYSKAAARTFNSTWINPINPEKSLNDLINNIPENTTCIYLDWDYGDNLEYHGGDVAKEIREKHPNIAIILTSSPPSMDELQQRIATPQVDGLLVFEKNLDAILRLFKTLPSNTKNYDEETPSINSTPVIETRKESPVETIREPTQLDKLTRQSDQLDIDKGAKFIPIKPPSEKSSKRFDARHRILN